MERMNYINRPKECYTQEEWIEYLEESIRELRKEKENLKKEKGEVRKRLVALEKNLETLSRVKENKELIKENKKLRDYVDNLDSENDNQAIEIEELKKENKKLEEERDLYKARNEELNENCFGLAKENENLKSDLSECECSFGFENDEVGYRKREYNKLKKRIKDHCNGYGNLFPEDEMKRQRKKADKKRKLKSTYVYDAKQVRDVC